MFTFNVPVNNAKIDINGRDPDSLMKIIKKNYLERCSHLMFLKIMQK